MPGAIATRYPSEDKPEVSLTSTEFTKPPNTTHLYMSSMYIIGKWFDIGIGLASGVFAFHTYQMKYIPEDRRLQTLLKRGYNGDKQKERLAAEAELENEATAELAKLFEGEQGNSKNSTAARI